MLLSVLAQAATDPGGGIPGWVYPLATLIGAGGLFRFFMIRSEQRMAAAGATKTEAEAQEIGDRVRKALMEEVEVKMQAARQEAREARAGEAAAIAKVDQLVAQHEADRVIWHRERHDLVNKGLDKDAEIMVLREEVKELKAHVHALEIRLGFAEGRRMTDLEERADASEAKADEAQGIADAQRQRNDDTPGHA